MYAPPASGMAAPSSAIVNAPNSESTPPTIQTRKTSPTEPVARVIAPGTRNTPVPMMWPTTIAMAAHAPSPSTSCGFSSLMFLRLRLLWRRLGFLFLGDLSTSAALSFIPSKSWHSTHGAARKRSNEKGRAGADKHIPRKGHLGELENTQDHRQSREHSDECAAGICAAIESSQQKQPKQAAKGKRRHGQPRFKQRPPFHEPEAQQHEAPHQGHAARHAQELARVGALSAKLCEIEHARSR